jgi:peptidoglycan/xylan/chitin deacetylase (PgdA/CDA1 family)
MGDSGAFAWPGGATRAISLTYDGALPEHLELVFPLLDRLSLKATFFVTPTSLLKYPAAWRKVADAGHEIASHSLFGVSVDGRLDNWTLQMVRDDLKMTQRMIEEVLGVIPRSFALPGPQPFCAEGSYRPVVNEAFEFVRTTTAASNDPETLELQNLASLRVDRWPMSKLADWASHLPDAPQRWDVYVFDKIFSAEVHLAEDANEFLCNFLATKRELIWTATVSEIGAYIQAQRSASSPEAAGAHSR